MKYKSINGVSSRNNLPKIKDEVYVINLDEYKSVGTHCITLYVNCNNGSANDNATYFKSFGIEPIPKEIKSLYETKISWQIFIEYKPTTR